MPSSPPWQRLYDAPRKLGATLGQTRVFAPESYPIVREDAMVPVVHGEILRLAGFYPLCWRLEAGRFVLVALRSLLPDGRGHPVPATHAAGALPLALKAYPLAVPERDENSIVVDTAPPDRPTDIGAPVLLESGQPSRAVVLRFRMIAEIQRQWPLTAALAERLDALDLLEPWPLDFDLGGGNRIARDDLFVFPESRSDHPSLVHLAATLGMPALMALAAHRLSLHRIGALVRAARAAFAQPAQVA